jgi:hypothetical protein
MYGSRSREQFAREINELEDVASKADGGKSLEHHYATHAAFHRISYPTAFYYRSEGTRLEESALRCRRAECVFVGQL